MGLSNQKPGMPAPTISLAFACNGIGLFGLFDGLIFRHPTLDALAVVLHVCIAQFLGGLGPGLIGLALLVAAISDNQRVFVRGKFLREFGFHGIEIERARDMPVAPALGAVDVKQDDLFSRS